MGVAAARMISIIRLLFSSTTLWAIQVPYMMIASKRNISSAEMTARSATSWASVSGTTDEAVGSGDRNARSGGTNRLVCDAGSRPRRPSRSATAIDVAAWRLMAAVRLLLGSFVYTVKATSPVAPRSTSSTALSCPVRTSSRSAARSVDRRTLNAGALFAPVLAAIRGVEEGIEGGHRIPVQVARADVHGHVRGLPVEVRDHDGREADGERHEHEDRGRDEERPGSCADGELAPCDGEDVPKVGARERTHAASPAGSAASVRSSVVGAPTRSTKMSSIDGSAISNRVTYS